MHWVHQKCTKPAVVVNQTDAPNFYWIMQENSAWQPRAYRHTRTFLKIRSTPTDGEQKAQMKEWMPEMVNADFQTPAVLNGNRDLMIENSCDQSPSGSILLLLHTLDLPNSQNFSEKREEDGKLTESLCTSDTTLENALSAQNAPVQ